MKQILVLHLLFFLFLVCEAKRTSSVREERNVVKYSNEWIIKTKDVHTAKEIASKYQMTVEESMFRSLRGYFLLRHNSIPKVGKNNGRRDSVEMEDIFRISNYLSSDPRVEFSELQKFKFQSKRVIDSKKKSLRPASSSKMINESFEYPQDPLFPQQWHLLNNGQNGSLPGIDVNVVPVWNNTQIAGRGVCIAIVDDGIIK